MSYLLEMKSITKAFGAVKAVDNVSLALESRRNRLALW